MELLKAIKNRRSTRRFTKSKIDDLKLISVLEAALWVPSAGNVQDKEFIIVREQSKKKGLAKACFNQSWIANAPVIIVLLSDVGKLRRFGKRADFYATISAGAAIQNMLLALVNQGLQGTNVGLFEEQAVKHLLQIPADRKVFAVMPLGKPAEKPPAPKRLDLKAFTFFEKHGTKWVKGKPPVTYEK